MGNYRFRISDMMPNAWFYKLKDMSRTKNHGTSRPTTKNLSSSSTMSQQPRLSQPQQSCYYTIESSNRDKHYNSPENIKPLETHVPPRRSKKKKTKRKTVYKPSALRQTTSSPSASDCSFRTPVNSIRIEPEPEPFQPQNYLDSSAESFAEFDFIKSSSSEFESDNFDAPRSFNGPALRSSSCSCRYKSSATDIVIDVNERSYTRTVEKDDFSTISEVDLPPILTKPVKSHDASGASRYKVSSELEEIQAHGSLSIKIIKEERIKTGKETSASPAPGKYMTTSPAPRKSIAAGPAPGKSITTSPAPRKSITASPAPGKSITASPAPRKSISQSTRVKVGANATKLASKRSQGQGRKSVSSNKCKSGKKTFTDSFAIVKASFDPEKDFRDSMMEMISENNIQASKDLEELLACYLSLNSDEYHELIVKAFEEIWFSMPQIHL